MNETSGSKIDKTLILTAYSSQEPGGSTDWKDLWPYHNNPGLASKPGRVDEITDYRARKLR